MEINRTTLQSAYVGFSTAFSLGLATSTTMSMYGRIASTVPSTTRANEYGWLGKLPGMRKWIGDRVIHAVEKDGYKITNEPYELTVSVDRDDFEDDNLGHYSLLFQQLGESVNALPDQLVFALLKAGFSTPCYDGQYFFDSDHPVIGADGKTVSVSNTGGGSGRPWFLLDTRRAIKPIIYQLRRRFDNLIRMDQDKDENVFNRKEYLYGTDGRCAVGFSFWQMAYGSRQALEPGAYEVGRGSMSSLTGDHGRPLNMLPNLLVVSPADEGAGRAILQSQLINGGESNKWAGTAELLVCPWLA